MMLDVNGRKCFRPFKIFRTVHMPRHNASRTPRPSMKRSRICTGPRRVVPVPGLSSIRTSTSNLR
jgi:hypothetical protein